MEQGHIVEFKYYMGALGIAMNVLTCVLWVRSPIRLPAGTARTVAIFISHAVPPLPLIMAVFRDFEYDMLKRRNPIFDANEYVMLHMAILFCASPILSFALCYTLGVAYQRFERAMARRAAGESS